MKCSLGISNFLEEISNLSHSTVSLYFFALITEGGFLIFSFYSLKPCIQMVIAFLFSFAFSFSSFLSYCKASSDNHFAFLHFFFLGMVLITASCMSQTSIHISWGTWSDLIPWIYLHLLHLFNPLNLFAFIKSLQSSVLSSQNMAKYLAFLEGDRK